jgi:hypothetical protein
LQGGPLGHGPCKMNGCCKLLEGLMIMLDLWWLWQIMSKSSFTNFSLYFEGEKVFGFVKKLIDCPFDVDNDSHCLDHVKFFHP